MGMTDPIADLLTRIRNASSVNHDKVIIPASNLKLRVVNLLLEEGFVFRDYIDPFDAGPTIEAKIDDLKTVSEQRQGKAFVDPNFSSEESYLIAAGHLSDFRVTCAQAEPQVAGLVMNEDIQERLSIHSGSLIQWSKL